MTTTAKRTAGPWKQGDRLDYHPRVVLHVPDDERESYIPICQCEREDDARHIVACVNAVENVGGDPDTVGELVEVCRLLLEYRDNGRRARHLHDAITIARAVLAKLPN